MDLIVILIILIILICVIYLVYINRLKKRCNLKVKGKVIARWTEEYGRFRNDAAQKGYRTYIIIEYEYNQKKYDKEIVISPFTLIKIHDEVEIMINPLKPEEVYGVYFSNEEIKKRMKVKDYIINLIISLPIIAIFIFVIFFVIVILLDELFI